MAEKYLFEMVVLYFMAESMTVQNKTNNVLALTGGRNVYGQSSGIQTKCWWKAGVELC